MNDDRLKKIVWFAGFEGRNSAVISKLILQKNWQHIFNSGLVTGKHARELRALR